MESQKTTIYVVSDSLGETAEQVARASSAQFLHLDMKLKRIPYVNSEYAIDEIIDEARKEINETHKCIIMFTLVVTSLKDYLKEQAEGYNIPCVDIMTPAMEAISRASGLHPTHIPGVIRLLDEEYFNKVEAIEFAVKYDDCKDPKGIKKADLVLLGVSRTSKTPLSMYLANKHLKVTNIPLLPEVKPPKELYEIPAKRIIGLITSQQKLNAIRLERLKAQGLSTEGIYANMERIALELKYAEEIMKSIGCTVIDVTDKAIEETASIILQILKEVNQ